MNKSLENFKKYLPLLQQFVKRDFKTKYRRSVLGILWSVLNPLWNDACYDCGIFALI